MAADGDHDIIDLFARKSEAFEDLLGQICADAFVFVKMDAAGLRIAGRGEGFGDIVKQDGPGKGRVRIRRQIFEHQEQVVEDCSFGMKIGRLITGDGGGNFGQDLFKQPALAKEVEATRGVGRAEEFDEFVPDSFGADGMNFGRGGFNGRECFRLDCEIELGGQPNGAKQAQMVFAKTFDRRADRANDFCAQIGFAADPIMQFALDWIIKKAVHGKVAAAGVSDGIAKNDIGRMASILVIGFGAKGGDLELVIVFENDNDAEFAADGNGALEKFFDLVGQGGGDDVIIPGFAAEKEIANATADPIRGEAGVLETADDLSGGFGHRVPIRETTNGHESTRMRAVK